jgi:hypothetical protein
MRFRCKPTNDRCSDERSCCYQAIALTAWRGWSWIPVDGLCGSIPINSTAAIPAISMTSFGSPNPASSMTLNFCGSSPCFSAAPWIGTSARTQSIACRRWTKQRRPAKTRRLLCYNPRLLRRAAWPESAGLHIARLYFWRIHRSARFPTDAG